MSIVFVGAVMSIAALHWLQALAAYGSWWSEVQAKGGGLIAKGEKP